jgi:PAS domain S-box-containing protein
VLKTYRESSDLIIVTLISIVFSSFGISVYFVDTIYSFLFQYASLPLVDSIAKFCFIYLAGLLWVTFRRWKRAEQEKKELEEAIASISPDVLVVADRKDTIVFCSQAVKRVFGYTVNEVVGQKRDLLCSDNPSYPEGETETHAIFRGKGFHKGFAKGLVKEGGEIPLEVISRDLTASKGAVILLRDITERKLMEATLHSVSGEASELLSKIGAAMRVKELYDDLGKVMSELSRYVSPPTMEVAEKVATGKEVGTGEIVDITVLFSDIRGFTRFTENMDPAEVFKMLNLYLSVQIKIVEEYHGIIDKLTGDEVMAVFTGPDMAMNALQCGGTIMKTLSNPQFQIGKEWIGVGIGINTGPAYIGSVGSETRKDHTVVGTTVNVAARLCGYAQKFQVILSENTKGLSAGSGFDCRSVGKVNLKGLRAPIEVFELI